MFLLNKEPSYALNLCKRMSFDQKKKKKKRICLALSLTKIPVHPKTVATYEVMTSLPKNFCFSQNKSKIPWVFYMFNSDFIY